MKKSIRDLLALQAVDIRIRNLEIRYKTIPTERANLVEEFEVVKRALAVAKNKLQKVELAIRNCQSETASEQENLKNSRIRSATVKKAAEFDAINAQIAGCEKRISELETKELELYDELEKAKADVVRAERKYKATGRQAQAEVRQLDELKGTILEEIRVRSMESKELEKSVAQASLAQYKRLLATGKGEPVSQINNGLCGNCSLKLTPMTLNQASVGDLVTCDHCSYFLYDPNPKQL